MYHIFGVFLTGWIQPVTSPILSACQTLCTTAVEYRFYKQLTVY